MSANNNNNNTNNPNANANANASGSNINSNANRGTNFTQPAANTAPAPAPASQQRPPQVQAQAQQQQQPQTQAQAQQPSAPQPQARGSTPTTATGSGRPPQQQQQQPPQQQYSQADLNKIVLEYLNKKGYHKTESMLRNESASVPIGYGQQFPVTPANTAIPNGQPPLVRQQQQQYQQAANANKAASNNAGGAGATGATGATGGAGASGGAGAAGTAASGNTGASNTGASNTNTNNNATNNNNVTANASSSANNNNSAQATNAGGNTGGKNAASGNTNNNGSTSKGNAANNASTFKLVNKTPSSEILTEINSQNKNPELYFRGYKILRNWIDSSLDLYKPELSKLLFPIFVNCYVDLISKNKTDLAKKFFDSFKDDHMILHGSEVIEISAVSLADHLKINNFIKNFREKKYKVIISSICLYLLLFFLNENKYVGGELIIRLMNQYLDFDINNDRVNRFNAVDSLLDPTEGIPDFNEQNLEKMNSKKLKLGKFPRDENFDKEIENELKSKDDKEQQKRKNSNSASAGAGAAVDNKRTLLVDEFQKIKSENANPTATESPSSSAAAKKPGDDTNADNADNDNVNMEDQEIPSAGGGGATADTSGTILDKLKKNDENFESPMKENLPLPPKTIFDLKKEIQLVQDSRSRLKLSFDKNQFSPPSICMYTFHNTLNEITCLEFNENSNLVAAGFEDSYIKLWSIDGNPLKSIVKSDPQNKQNTRRLIGHSGTVYALSFSPDNNYLLSASEDGTVRLWSLDTYTTLVIYKSHNLPIWDVKFSPFGHYFVTTSHDCTARLWSVDHIYALRIFAGHMNDVDCVAWFPNSCYCFTGSADKTIRMWDILRGDSVRLFVGHSTPINALAVSPDGRLLASAGEDAVINLWDIATGRILKSMKGHAIKGSIYSLDFSKDGNVLVSGGSDNSIRVWDVKKNSENQLSEPEVFLPNHAASGAGAGGKDGKDGSGSRGIGDIKTATVTTPGGSTVSQAADNNSVSAKSGGGVGTKNGAATGADGGAGSANGGNEATKKRKEVGVCTNDHVGAYFTKKTSVYKVHFTRRNLCLAAGAFLA